MDEGYHAVVTESQIRDVAYAVFQDFSGEIPSCEGIFGSGVIKESDGTYRISMANRGQNFTVIDQFKKNSDESVDVIVSLRYEDDGEGNYVSYPGDVVFSKDFKPNNWWIARAVSVHLVPNKQVNAQSNQPFYYTISSFEPLVEWNQMSY